jgi:hypothetical protein
MTLREVKVLIADDSTTVHPLIRDSLPGDYSTGVMQAFDGVECLNVAGWTRYGLRELRATRPSLR